MLMGGVGEDRCVEVWGGEGEKQVGMWGKGRVGVRGGELEGSGVGKGRGRDG